MDISDIRFDCQYGRFITNEPEADSTCAVIYMKCDRCIHATVQQDLREHKTLNAQGL